MRDLIHKLRNLAVGAGLVLALMLPASSAMAAGGMMSAHSLICLRFLCLRSLLAILWSGR